jgi:PleD family two-component response regulator
VFVIDVRMPVIDGFGCMELIRADASIAMAPILFLSAIGDTAEQVRALDAGVEDYVLKPFHAAELVARVRKALKRHSVDTQTSPTTHMPGAATIQAEIERRLLADRSAVACYLDLDNLKAYNDYYGYARANAIIRQTGDLIRAAVNLHADADNFAGHIAGDDFVFVTTAERADSVCREICERFDRLIPHYYDGRDREARYIETNDRFGVQRRFPLMSVSIAAVTLSRARSYVELAELAAGGKQTAKAIPGSTYVRDGDIIYSAQRP